MTPNLDALAQRGMIYLQAWSTAPVYAPARTAIISGLYPSATGAEHMRSDISLPASLRLYPQWLRAAGYYCVNNSKEDYNLRELDESGLAEETIVFYFGDRGPGMPRGKRWLYNSGLRVP